MWRDSSWYGDVCFSNSLWRKQSRLQLTLLSDSRNLKQGNKAWNTLQMLGLAWVKIRLGYFCVYRKEFTHSWYSKECRVYNKSLCHTNVCKHNFLSFKVSFKTCISLPPTVFSLFHHSVKLFFLPLSNRAADAEPGPHSKTAGVRVSQLINTQNYLPPPNHISFFSNMHTEKQKERGNVFQNHFIKYTLTAFWQTQYGHWWTLVPGQKWAAKQQGQHKKWMSNFMTDPHHL